MTKSYPSLTVDAKRRLWRPVVREIADHVLNAPDVPMRLSTTQGTGTYTISPELLRYLMSSEKLGTILMDFLKSHNIKLWSFYHDYLRVMGSMPVGISALDERTMAGLAAIHCVSARTAYNWRDNAEDILRGGMVYIMMRNHRRQTALDKYRQMKYNGQVMTEDEEE